MSKLGAYLFETSSDNIDECLSAMIIDDTRDCSEYQVFLRGEEYYREGLVREIIYHRNKNTVTSEVKGSSIYRLEYRLTQGSLHATCDCPYDDVCKHIVATLLSILYEGLEQASTAEEIIASPVEIRANVHKYLKSLPKSQLVNFIMKFAPEDFFM